VRATRQQTCGRRTRQAALSRHRFDQTIFGHFQKRNNLLARDAWEALKEIINGLPGFKIIEPRLNRDAGTVENRGASQYVRIRWAISWSKAYAHALHRARSRIK